MNEPFFSICIPSHNREKTIFETLGSVARQKFRDFEVIIADYGSKDNTREEIKKFFNSKTYNKNKFNYKLKLINKKLIAVEDWNEPLKLARGKYIAMLEGDDQFEKNHLRDAHRYLRDKKSIGIYASGNQYRKRLRLGKIKSKDYFRQTYSHYDIPPPSEVIFIRLDKNNQPFMYNVKDFGYCPEFDLHLRISRQGFDAYHSNSRVFRGPSSPNSGLGWKYHKDQFIILEKYKDYPDINKKVYLSTRKKLYRRAIYCCLVEIYRKRIFTSDFKKKIIEKIGIFRFYIISLKLIMDYFARKSRAIFS